MGHLCFILVHPSPLQCFQKWEFISTESGLLFSGGGNISVSFPGGSVVKNLPAHAGDVGSIPERGRILEEKMATHSSVLAWRIPWIAEPGGLQSRGSQKAWTQLSDQTTIVFFFKKLLFHVLASPIFIFLPFQQ